MSRRETVAERRRCLQPSTSRLEHEVTASLETLAVAAYVLADSIPIPRNCPKGKITDAELIALAVAQAAMGECAKSCIPGGLPSVTASLR